MLTRDELQALVRKNQALLNYDLGLQRHLPITLRPKFATIISGIRRCGKSTLARQCLADTKPVYYLHFEDVSLANFELQDFKRLDETFRSTLGEGGTYFFDEIQNIKGWETHVRSLTDAGHTIIITGSNASMLSRELGTKLTGRNLRYELYPFSYEEYLRLLKKKSSKKSFMDYLTSGGFPEYLKTGDQHIIRNLFQDILYRDIIVRNDIRNEGALKSLISFISGNIGKELSYTKLAQTLGIRSVNTVSQFIDACEQAYLFFSINKFDYSLKKQMVNPKKIYCIDTAIIILNSFSISPNLGRLLENLVYIELRRKGAEIYYHKQDKECDFVIKEGHAITQAIQVCHDLTDDNREREIRGLLEAMQAYKLKKGLLLTCDQKDDLTIDGKSITIMPVWKWTLEPSS